MLRCVDVSAGQEQGVFVTSMVGGVALRCQGPVSAQDDHTGVSGQGQ